MHELKLGDKSPAVINIKRLLNRFGSRLTLTPLFDVGTEGELKNVQQLMALPPTGIYDQATEEAIFNRLSLSFTKLLAPSQMKSTSPKVSMKKEDV